MEWTLAKQGSPEQVNEMDCNFSIFLTIRHYEACRRPVFSAIVKMLSHSDAQLLSWSAKDLAVHPQVSQLGAAKDVSSKLYQELQDYYLDRT